MRTSRWLYAALPPICILSLVLGTGGAPVSAQADPRERTLYVSALDDEGRPVEGLGPDAFVVREDGVSREILKVLPADEPIDLTVMIDNSQEARSLIPILRTALPPFLEALTPENRVALITLAERPTIAQAVTTETQRLVDRARGIFAQSESGTTLLDAMAEVSSGIRKRNPTRAVIVAITTDGPEFTNRYSRDVVGALVKAQAAVHLVTIGRFNENIEHAARERNFFIAQAPDATGGQHISLLAPQALEESLERIARELTSQYEVVYLRPDALIPPDEIDVTAARPGLTVRGTPRRAVKGE